jgi:hypothetical protein
MSVPLCLTRPILDVMGLLKTMTPLAYPTPRAYRLAAELWEELQAAKTDMESDARRREVEVADDV